ncbi:MAG: cysteine--tRNA ligase [Coriobacteriales bacterium]|jgi:cysteinyl-tRNA synthetase|nr:cysteine--tRNA ligase [Coriobacteriales bacterium]
MQVYNTLTRRKEEFQPIQEGHIGFYLCGPTVYNHIHIGNARTFISFDTIRRYLIWRGYDVTFVQNLTDVDDKIINKANEEGRDAQDVAAEYSQAFQDAMRALNVMEPSVQPTATGEMQPMIELISCLIDGGHAYEVDGDVYFSVRSLKDYGRLSGRDIEQLQSGARVEVDERKHDPLDFALWKAAKPGEPSWPSPWGDGRPGWHTECSAMSAKYLGLPFDIHAGGNDLIFPHHENELAQAQACGHKGFANYWLHGGMLTINEEKMSKSEGNFLLLKDVLGHVRPEALRLLMLQTHYRSQFDYSVERLHEATSALEHIESALQNISWAIETSNPGAIVNDAACDIAPAAASGASGAKGANGVNGVEEAVPQSRGEVFAQAAKARERFTSAMDDDFNTPQAIAAIYDLIGIGNKAAAAGVDACELEDVLGTVTELLGVLGVDIVSASEAKSGSIPAEIDVMLGERAEARARKDWARADEIRDELDAMGYVIEDTASGTRVVRK